MPEKAHKSKVCDVSKDRVSLPIFRTSTGYLLKYRLRGKLLQIHRAKLEVVKALALDACKKIAAGQTAQLSISNEDASAWHRVKTIAGNMGKEPLAVMQEYHDSFLKLRKPFTVLQACDDFARRNHNPFVPAPLSSLIEPFLQQLVEDDSNLSRKYLSVLGRQLREAAREFTEPIHALTAEMFSQWLRKKRHRHTGLALTAKSRNSIILRLNVFFHSATARKHLPEGWDELSPARVKRPKNIQPEVKIFSIEELTTLLLGAEGHIHLPTPEAIAEAEERGETIAPPNNRQKRRLMEIVPCLAIGMFGSSRNDVEDGEISKLDWRNIELPQRNIRMPATTSKVRVSRDIPISETLADWLLPYAQKSGPIIAPGTRKRRELLCRLTGIKWSQNILRKSCVSYRNALIKNLAEVADDAGTSVGVARRSYRTSLPKSEGERWDSIRRPSANNVVTLPKADQNLGTNRVQNQA